MPKQKPGNSKPQEIRRLQEANAATELALGIILPGGMGTAAGQGARPAGGQPDKPEGKEGPSGGAGGSKGGSAPAPGGSCFAAGTRVLMGDGSLRAIEAIRAGDAVLAFDEPTGEVTPRRVRRTYEHAPEPVLSLWVRGVAPAILVTPAHPFYMDRRWAPIGDAGPSARLTMYDAGSGHVEDCELGSLSPSTAVVPVFNLKVDGAATYFVEGVLVHNKDDDEEEEPG